MYLMAFIAVVAALICFPFAAWGREFCHFNEIALGVFLAAGLNFRFTSATGSP